MVVYFTIAVMSHEKAWTVERRFSQFDALHKELKSAFPQLPQLPPKTMLKVSNPEAIGRRKQALNTYLRELVARASILNSAIMSKFLDVSTLFQALARPAICGHPGPHAYPLA